MILVEDGEREEGKKRIARVPGEPRGWKKPRSWGDAEGPRGHLPALLGEGSALKL